MKIHSLLGPVRIFLRAAAPLALLCTFPIPAQEQPPASPDAPPVAPAQEQINLNGDSAIQPASPAPSEIALKNNRLFYVLANYSTVEKHDQFGTLSAKTKFKLSVKTMSDPVTVGISNPYHPDYQRTFGNSMTVWGTDILLNTLCNIAKEFWPDIRRKIHNHKHPD